MCAKAATMRAKVATMCDKAATMCAKNAITCAKAATIGGQDWKLPASPATACRYLRQGGVPSLRTMDDGAEFRRAVDALATLGASSLAWSLAPLAKPKPE